MDFKKFKAPKNKNILVDVVNDQPTSKAKLTDHIMVKLMPEERQKISELAEQQCIKMSPFVRSILRKHGYI